uniref:CBS domain-containing protein n=2 Tax=Corethron hystrix TaxID=216773 RepID=A0A7S1BKI0_9STRA|mmetsp:Transcript_32099/g.73856  ORF Transcript_32099/g.73856 Transcript_32099/m.73856 type:complete len:347 (+) Transcript_32099:406-1446(+)|eukprot:CAMPEP_0113314016 /NCGR_PEP_ID=MMETSP0010_2-20120614/10232_1 /TAXON_ID=216773 ORGANISM="Corethron hystrix, Strain 308" /NCGR_SAMPLE_ID=MMETSP0010_2 /ASSEMBLY_ACC=CAM_ASM_000155 /LENGTH=346 /DNA_ID=CAMNT_0000170191 /DNA_START=328 /DNA_END=1368 /DNA_ORIENTATION=- /assembly_acc=CAM_ASM_000155
MDNNDSGSLRKTPSTSILHDEKRVIREAGRQAINEFLESHNCFSVLRYSGKVVVFDTRIPIQLAFYALVEHDMQTAPLWNPSIRQFVGLLTVTDFIDILRYYSQNGLPVSDLATRTIADILADPNLILKHSNFLAADATATLKHSCKLLHENSLDFLPVILPSDMRVLATVTYTNILEHLVTHFREQRRLFDDTIYDLGIGTYNNVITVCTNQSLSECLHLLQTHELSSVPVVDQEGRVINVYSRSDITFLATASDADDAIRNLNLTLGEILDQQREILTTQRADVSTPDRLHTCTPSHTLQSIFEYFAQLKFNRLIVTDDDHRCVGVVSARDLVAYFVSGCDISP